MGRTVYGVDLEESPFGGLIEKLLTEEELEKLADGGAPDARAAPDGGGDDDEDDDWSASDETDGSSDDTGIGDVDSETGDAGIDDGDSSGTSSWSPSPSSPPPSTDRDDGYGWGPGYEDGGEASFLSKHKWLLLKVAVAFAALAAVGVVVWRYKDRLADLVPGRGGGDADEFDLDEPSVGAGNDADASPARQRAKVGEDGSESDADDGEDEEGVETPGRDLDLGALVGLGVLALVAALVRKYDEERNRPHDPLVDGPLDEGEDDVADGDQ